jgi:hypothetical protein
LFPFGPAQGEQQAAIAPFAASVGADGLYEVVEDAAAARA